LPPQPAATVETPGANFVNRRVAKDFPVDDKAELEMCYATAAEYFPAEENEDSEDLWCIVHDDEEKEDFTVRARRSQEALRRARVATTRCFSS
jgi:hypothetical protein